jgi:hypothetical protein
MRTTATALLSLSLCACLTDPATRLAYDLESAAGRLDGAQGATVRLVHRVPSKRGECDGPYRVQLDRVGALVIWCQDATGTRTVSSHSTSYHGRFVVTPATTIVDKPANAPLVIDLERRDGRAVIVGAS